MYVNVKKKECNPAWWVETDLNLQMILTKESADSDKNSMYKPDGGANKEKRLYLH